MPASLYLLCAGAAQALVKALEPRLLAETGATLDARFGAVGAMKEALLAGAACDVMVTTDKMVGELEAAGLLRGETRAALGRVRTGLAVRSGAPRPDVGTPEALQAALLGADAVYFPDALRSTAGIHFAAVLRQLGIHDRLEARFRTFPNGATAMRELALHGTPRSIGCTQVTEIKYTAGVELVALLPARFELATTYTAALSATTADAALAAGFVAMLTGGDTRALRTEAGFEN
jgi:molybdate transport system substrate-binding protein